MVWLILFLLSARVEVFFSSTDGCRDKIIQSIKNTKESLYIAAYSFTSREISQAVIDAVKRGVDVKVIMDFSQARNRFSKFTFLVKNGVDVRTPNYTPRRKRFLIPKMHHKFIIFDKKYVMTGSYNLTASAEELNDENCVFIYDDPNVVKKFLDEFRRLWKISK